MMHGFPRGLSASGIPGLPRGLSASRVGGLPERRRERYERIVLNDSPAFYWRLGERQGTLAYPAAGTAIGTYTGGYTLGAQGALAGDPDAGAAFNGSSGYVACGSLDLSGPSLTLECWCYPTAFSSSSPWESTMVGNGNGSSQVAALNFGNGSSAGNNAKPRLAFYNGSSYPTIVWPSQLAANNWYHIVGTYNGTALNLYVNGVATTPVAAAGNVVASGTTELGRYLSARHFTGTLDEVAIYRYALSAQQVLEHYRTGV